ncbi:LGFP repeat-containing protein [Rhodococcus sp. JT-3]|uniref:LGFP repeat-containing protein n=1 Tax=Rhodococcus sp. JT-3 TaxID=1973213 RepID=UPI00130391A5|nr:hypothetical protein [Rhodococcus sp. JT-3]
MTRNHLALPESLTYAEVGTPNGIGRFNRFTEGNIYFNPQAGTHCVYGAIFAEYGRHGYEGGGFGFPTTDEYATPDAETTSKAAGSRGSQQQAK